MAFGVRRLLSLSHVRVAGECRTQYFLSLRQPWPAQERDMLRRAVQIDEPLTLRFIQTFRIDSLRAASLLTVINSMPMSVSK